MSSRMQETIRNDATSLQHPIHYSRNYGEIRRPKDVKSIFLSNA